MYFTYASISVTNKTNVLFHQYATVRVSHRTLSFISVTNVLWLFYAWYLRLYSEWLRLHFDSRLRLRFFSVSGVQSTSYTMYTRDISAALSRPESKVPHSPPSSATIKTVPFPPRLRGVVLCYAKDNCTNFKLYYLDEDLSKTNFIQRWTYNYTFTWTHCTRISFKYHPRNCLATLFAFLYLDPIQKIYLFTY
jgi:hypothetical protein